MQWSDIIILGLIYLAIGTYVAQLSFDIEPQGMKNEWLVCVLVGLAWPVILIDILTRLVRKE